jgi:hypothetical protein
VSITAPTETSSEEGTLISFAATASDTEDGDLTASLSWTSDLDGPIGTGGSFTTSSLSVGIHSITASVTDSGGLTASDTIKVTIYVNTAPTVTIIEPENNKTYIVGELINFAASVDDPDPGQEDLASYVIWTSNKDGYLDTGDSVSALTVGNHTITATVTDDNGATASSDVLIRLRKK